MMERREIWERKVGEELEEWKGERQAGIESGGSPFPLTFCLVLGLVVAHV